MADSEFRFPSDQQRLVIVGATGSGKTNDGLWHLSGRNYDEKPWVIYNYKNDELIDSIEGATELPVDAPPPDRPGVYIVHPYPGQETQVDNQMVQIWSHENTGVFVDEALMIPRNSVGFRSMLTQGRSKHIPMITCSQRPAWIDHFVFTEAEFIQMFRLQDIDDVKKVARFVPNPNTRLKDHPLFQRLPEYSSYYYDVGRNKLMKLNPVPDPDAILDTFDMRLRKLRKVI